MKIFISRKILGANINSLKKFGIEIDIWNSSMAPTKSQLVEKCRNVSGLICMLSDNIDQALINNCPNLLVIANYAVGFNNIDTDYAQKKQIPVGNTPDVLTEATADLAFALTLACSRQILNGAQSAIDGHWKDFEPQGHLGLNLRSKTVGILGAGRIGSAYANLMNRAFQTKTLYYSLSRNMHLETSISAEKTGLRSLLKQSDIISIHLPISSSTQLLIGTSEFEILRPNCILINTARGGIIDQNILIRSLENKKIFAAGLDVTTPEPLNKKHKLFELENCIITPHIGSATFDARKRMTEICFENIIAGLNREKLPYPVI